MAIVTYNATLTEWENIIRVKLKVSNPALLKSGALGILTNYLAGIKYDTLQFYTKTFQEMNVGLAQDFNSMLYHSTIYGTELEFAVPSTLTSSLVIPEINVQSSADVIYNIPRYTSFTDANGIPFTFISDLRLEYTPTGMNATAWNPQQGTRKLVVTKAPNPNVAGASVFLVHNTDAQQFSRNFQTELVPTYYVGETYSFAIPIGNILNLKEINVWINTGEKLTPEQKYSLELIDPNDIEGSFDGEGPSIKKLETRFYKYDSAARDDHIFVELSEGSIKFETGDGIHGGVLPGGAELIIEWQLTLGENGNVPNSEFLLTNVYVGNQEYVTTINGLSTTGSYGGKNIQQIDGIRENIFDQITIRNSIITENDYERLFAYQDVKPFVDAKFLDAKAFVFIFNVVHDNDQVIYTNAFNYKEADLIQQPFYPVTTYAGVDLVSPFYYKNKGPNEVDAYIVDPLIGFNIEQTPDSPNLGAVADYRVDMALTYEFQRTQTGMTGKSFIEILGDVNEDYEYRFYCSWLGAGGYIVLNKANAFKYEVNSMYTDTYCIIREQTKNIKIEVYSTDLNQQNNYAQSLVAIFEDTGIYHQLKLKQTFYKYFKQLPDNETVTITTTRDSVSYLDNSLHNIMSTVADIQEPGEVYNYETYLLRLPFIDLAWFGSKNPSEIFEMMDDYFVVEYLNENINYNTQLTQTFHNTIDIPLKYYPYLFEKNNMPTQADPKFEIIVKIFVDRNSFIISKYNQISDLELAIKIAIIKFMKNKEGFQIDFFETDLEKAIYNEFHPVIKNIRVENPTRFQVNNTSVIYNLIQENLEFDDVLGFVPPYFYYDYANIDITIEM